jgi:hypothetical protein
MALLTLDVPRGKGAAPTLGCSKRFEFLADPRGGRVPDFQPVTLASHGRTSIRGESLPPVEPSSALVRSQGARYRQPRQLRTIGSGHLSVRVATSNTLAIYLV